MAGIKKDSMKKFIQYISLLFIFFNPSGSIAQDLKNNALPNFIKQFDAWKKSKFRESPGLENPWKPYLGRSFYEGLSLQDQKLYLSLQDSGDCFSVAQLDLLGFSRLYPFLTPAFERKDIRASFEGNIAFRYSEGVRRCFAFRSARRASFPKNNIDVQKAIILPLKGDRIFSGPNIFPISNLGLPETVIKNAFMNIYYLAICRNYMPAIRDLENYSKKKKIILTPIDKAYLSIRSAELGMNDIPSAQLYKQFNNAPFRNDIRDKQRRSTEMQLFGSVEINFQTYYAKLCGPHSN